MVADSSLGAAVNKVFDDPQCQNMVAEYRVRRLTSIIY